MTRVKKPVAQKTSAQKVPAKTRDSRKNNTLNVDHRWLARAEAVAEAPVSEGGSPHPSVKVGAVLVNAKGREIAGASNRFPTGVDRRRPDRYRDGFKSLWINCAEQMALAQALKKRADIKDATMYVTLEPCAVCAGLIAELKIKRVCVPVGSLRRYAKLKAKWKESIEIGMIKLAEAGIELVALDVAKKARDIMAATCAHARLSYVFLTPNSVNSLFSASHFTASLL